MLLDSDFGITFQAEEGVTQRYFGKKIRLSFVAPGTIIAHGENGKTQLCDIFETYDNGYVKINVSGEFYHLFSSKVGEYLKS